MTEQQEKHEAEPLPQEPETRPHAAAHPATAPAPSAEPAPEVAPVAEPDQKAALAPAAEPASEPAAAADGEDAPQGSSAAGDETTTAVAGGNTPAEGEAAASVVAGPAAPAPTSVPDPASESRPPKGRRILRGVLRWTAAVVVFAACGAGTAYGVSAMDRTDVPGLATRSDGRWDYPVLEKPPLPSGRPGPMADANSANSHYADLRELVLPAPEGVKADPALRGTDGWLDRKAFLAEFAEDQREEMAQQLTDYGLRHIAARGWTMPDGTRTRIFLLQFSTAAVAEALMAEQLTDYSAPVHPFRGAELYQPDEGFATVPRPKGISFVPYDEQKPYGAEQLRLAFVSAGDTVAVVEQSRKGRAAVVPFQQTVILQSELLS
jgi:hypothetical protein